MRIQKIEILSNKTASVGEHEIVSNTFTSPKSMADFDINIINLDDFRLWNSENNGIHINNQESNFLSISADMANTNSKKIFFLPQNHQYVFKRDEKPIKDVLGVFYEIISPLVRNNGLPTILFSSTQTEIAGKTFLSDFIFSNTTEPYLTKSTPGGKTTTVKFGDAYFTTLRIPDNDSMLVFLAAIGLIHNQYPVPEWFTECTFFDDTLQKKTIDDCNIIIAQQKEIIKCAKGKLSENDYYKSILYKNGDELVKVVYKMLEKLLDCDLSAFVGEIKGVSSGVRSEHISQVSVHASRYRDDLETMGFPEENIKQILIINPQLKIQPRERHSVAQTQQNLAVTNNCLIIETITLLLLYEKFLNNKTTAENVLSVFMNKTGLLSETDF